MAFAAAAAAALGAVSFVVAEAVAVEACEVFCFRFLAPVELALVVPLSDLETRFRGVVPRTWRQAVGHTRGER